jgi:hypothetical protein
MNRRLFAACVLALTLLAMVGAGARGGSPIGASGAQCSASATKTLVREFVRGYNRGRVRLINRLWAPEPRFEWFSTGPPGARIGDRAYDRTTLAAYFRSRVRAHERLRLVKLGAGYDSKRRIVNFGGKLVRSAGDIARRGPQDFKGAAACVPRRPLIVWSM